MLAEKLGAATEVAMAATFAVERLLLRFPSLLRFVAVIAARLGGGRGELKRSRSGKSR